MFQRAQPLLWRWMASSFLACVVIFTVSLKFGESHLPSVSINHNRSHGGSLHPLFFHLPMMIIIRGKRKDFPGCANWLLTSQSYIISQWEHSITVGSTSYFSHPVWKQEKIKNKDKRKLKKQNKTKQRHRPLLAISKKYTKRALLFCLSFSESMETFVFTYIVCNKHVKWTTYT